MYDIAFGLFDTVMIKSYGKLKLRFSKERIGYGYKVGQAGKI